MGCVSDPVSHHLQEYVGEQDAFMFAVFVFSGLIQGVDRATPCLIIKGILVERKMCISTCLKAHDLWI